ncbi:hypothetical protein H311_01444 [Anncaliia algerae PRA109]|nr:hypothetical protein H311_01444 [Anncaliia algerae PRA109]
MFERNILLKEVKVELFMIECCDEFEMISLRNKMLQVIRRSSDELKEVIYDLGVKEELPPSWEEFKSLIIEFCSEEGIESIIKYKEEPWSKYLLRLDEWRMKRKHPENKVLSYVRKLHLPKDLRMILFSLEVSLKMAIERVKEWESFRCYNNQIKVKSIRINKTKMEKTNKDEKRSLNQIKCFSCGKLGQYSNKCLDKKKINRVLAKKYLDRNEIEINGMNVNAIFDTGSSCSFIHKENLIDLGIKDCEKGFMEFTNCDCSKWSVNRFVRFHFTFKDRKFYDLFWIIESEGDDVIISNEIVKKIKSKPILITYTIDTKDKGPINWTRPIRSYQDKREFEKLLKI